MIPLEKVIYTAKVTLPAPRRKEHRAPPMAVWMSSSHFLEPRRRHQSRAVLRPALVELLTVGDRVVAA